MDAVIDFFKQLIEWLTAMSAELGYPGIIFLMAIESSFIPFPSEVVMPPAGMLIQRGEMSWFWVIFSGLLGSMIGAYINYFLAAKIRKMLEKHGKWFLIKPESLAYCDRFFQNHGEFATFCGRLVPVVRQLVSLPAGLARMNLLRFSIYTALGAGIWIVVLTYAGYVFGDNEQAIMQFLHEKSLYILAALSIAVIIYIVVYKKRHSKNTESTTKEPQQISDTSIQNFDTSVTEADTASMSNTETTGDN